MSSLLDAEFMERLDSLSFLSRRRRGRTGEHLTWHRGASMEFEDYREYRSGDDIRHIDWNVWKRLDRFAVKRFAAEEDMTVHLLLDVSGSMGYGQPSKLHHASRVAAALGYIAWRRMDAVLLAAFTGGMGETLVPARRRGGPTELFGALSRLQSGGETRFNESLKNYALRAHRPGLAVVFSDLLDPAGYRTGLEALRYRRFDVLLIHVLCSQDCYPVQRGDLHLVDAETGKGRKIRVNRALADRYREMAEGFIHDASTFCRRRGMEYILARSELPFQELVLTYLRGGAFLR